MQLLRFVPIKLTAFLILGILIGSFFRPNISTALISTIVLITALAVIFFKERNRKGIVFGCTTFLLTISIGILTTALSNTKNLKSDYTNFENTKTT
ncbi:MAG: ComEC family competence protein, partial [Aurantibacter sp.]